MAQQVANRVAVVTGASSGIGKAAAKELVAQGWHVIAHGRDAGRSAAAEAEIRAAAAKGGKVDMIRGDLALLSDTARMIQEIERLTSKIDVLLNNAGGVRDARSVTPEGNEATFAGNHLGHFLLTNRLLPLLRSAAKSSTRGSVRVVNVSSVAHTSSPGIDWDDLQLIQNWSSGKSYCLAKLCNILFTRELANRLSADGIVVNAMHPGIVASNFFSHAEPEMRAFFATKASRTPEDGADTLLWLATAPEATAISGGYFYDREAISPTALALDADSAARLWTESEALVARAGV